MLFFGPGPMRDVYLDFRLPWPAKIAAGMLTPEEWWSFEIYLTKIFETETFIQAKKIIAPTIFILLPCP
jgi:hypothetical protein